MAPCNGEDGYASALYRREVGVRCAREASMLAWVSDTRVASCAPALPYSPACARRNTCIEEEEGAVTVRDDLDTLLTVCPFKRTPVNCCYARVLQRHRRLPHSLTPYRPGAAGGRARAAGPAPSSR